MTVKPLHYISNVNAKKRNRECYNCQTQISTLFVFFRILIENIIVYVNKSHQSLRFKTGGLLTHVNYFKG